MVCPVCNSMMASMEELNKCRKKHAIERIINMSPEEKEQRRRGLQALCDLEEFRANYPGF